MREHLLDTHAGHHGGGDLVLSARTGTPSWHQHFGGPRKRISWLVYLRRLEVESYAWGFAS